jgi:predicted Zn-dependent protease
MTSRSDTSIDPDLHTHPASVARIGEMENPVGAAA